MVEREDGLPTASHSNSFGVGEIVRPNLRVRDNDLDDLRRLRRHKDVYGLIRGLQDKGLEVWAQTNAHKGVIITVVSAAAFTAGVVGVGIYIRRRGQKREGSK